jgi:hypothetical protein
VLAELAKRVRVEIISMVGVQISSCKVEQGKKRIPCAAALPICTDWKTAARQLVNLLIVGRRCRPAAPAQALLLVRSRTDAHEHLYDVVMPPSLNRRRNT